MAPPDGSRDAVTRGRHAAARAACVAALGALLMLGCHQHPATTAPTPKAGTAARAATEPGARTDRQWIDSVAASWAAAPASAPAAAQPTARTTRAVAQAAPAAPQSATGPALTSTSYAEAAPTPITEESVGGPDRLTPLAVLAAIGLLALLATVFMARIALLG